MNVRLDERERREVRRQKERGKRWGETERRKHEDTSTCEVSRGSRLNWHDQSPCLPNPSFRYQPLGSNQLFHFKRLGDTPMMECWAITITRATKVYDHTHTTMWIDGEGEGQRGWEGEESEVVLHSAWAYFMTTGQTMQLVSIARPQGRQSFSPSITGVSGTASLKMVKFIFCKMSLSACRMSNVPTKTNKDIMISQIPKQAALIQSNLVHVSALPLCSIFSHQD